MYRQVPQEISNRILLAGITNDGTYFSTVVAVVQKHRRELALAWHTYHTATAKSHELSVLQMYYGTTYASIWHHNTRLTSVVIALPIFFSEWATTPRTVPSIF